MARRRAVDAPVQALLDAHHVANPESLVQSLCHDLLRDAEAAVPVDLDVLASYRNARVRIVDHEQAETIAWDGRHWHIHVSQRDTPGRQRFSCAHGIVHTFFMDAERTRPSAGVSTPAKHAWSEQEEQLCDIGAAELLLPRVEFLARCPAVVTMATVLELASYFEASAEATALRVVTLSSVPAALVVLEPQLKPVEQRAVAKRRQQQSLPGLEDPQPAPVPRLRVQKSKGNGLPFIPKHKSVDDDSLLAAALTNEIDGIDETGLFNGEVRVSARYLPIRRDGVLVDRVVALLFDEDAEWRQRRRTS
jgi:Zn-dependent peptidase ImmA (M78 family)